MAQFHARVAFGIGQSSQLELHNGTENLRGSSVFALPLIRGPDANSAVYQWDFGDGTKIRSSTPTVQYDYTNSLNPLVEY